MKLPESFSDDECEKIAQKLYPFWLAKQQEKEMRQNVKPITTSFRVEKENTGYSAICVVDVNNHIFTQAETLDELYKNCAEASELHFEEKTNIQWEFI